MKRACIWVLGRVNSWSLATGDKIMVIVRNIRVMCRSAGDLPCNVLKGFPRHIHHAALSIFYEHKIIIGYCIPSFKLLLIFRWMAIIT